MKRNREQERSDMSEDWAVWKGEIKEEKVAKQEWSKELLQPFCAEHNISFTEIQPWHFRLSNEKIKIDIFPQTQKWHNINTNQRGRSKNLIGFLTELISK